MSREIERKAVGREISKEEETGTGIEGGSPARSRGAGCRGELFSSGVLARSIRNEHGDGPGFGIVSCILHYRGRIPECLYICTVFNSKGSWW